MMPWYSPGSVDETTFDRAEADYNLPIFEHVEFLPFDLLCANYVAPWDGGFGTPKQRFFRLRLPDGTRLRNCTLRAATNIGVHVTGENQWHSEPVTSYPTIQRLYSTASNPTSTSDWQDGGIIEVTSRPVSFELPEGLDDSGTMRELAPDWALYEFSDLDVEAKWLGFLTTQGESSIRETTLGVLDVRQYVDYPEEQVEIVHPDGVRQTEVQDLPPVVIGLLGPLVHRLRVKNSGASTVVRNIRRTMRYVQYDPALGAFDAGTVEDYKMVVPGSVPEELLEIESFDWETGFNRVELSLDGENFVAQHLLNVSIPPGGIDLWMRINYQAHDRGIARRFALGSVWLEVP